MEAPFPPDNAQKHSVTSRHPWTRCKLQGFHRGAGPTSSSTGHLSSVRQEPQDKPGNYTIAAGWVMWTKAAVGGKALSVPTLLQTEAQLHNYQVNLCALDSQGHGLRKG